MTVLFKRDHNNSLYIKESMSECIAPSNGLTSSFNPNPIYVQWYQVEPTNITLFTPKNSTLTYHKPRVQDS